MIQLTKNHFTNLMKEVENKLNRTITIDSPEFQDLYNELSQRADTMRKREELSDESFRVWFCNAIKDFAANLGYQIQNLYEFSLDVGYSFKKGFKAGREQAKRNSIRYKEKNE